MLLAIGGNLSGHRDSPIGQVQDAIARLEDTLGETLTQSHLYRTPCFPPGAGPDFINAALAFQTERGADIVLPILHQIEGEMGRMREKRWGARVIDIDLLAHGQRVLPDLAGYQHWAGLAPEAQARLAPERLILPHPRLHERAFVLVPLMDIAPDWVHPVLGLSVRQMHAALRPEELAEIVPVTG
ncbi:MAG: 2-amino-4-hydroxy-6-hydroxymethyldihydropteridine diphosphokinase [Rhodobacteraceae bacterium]|nr:2-amino-4-hydroxy-6-hydroxymethyldihydropteridine diphosphokinase [Paracoccaceae bacterium]